MKILLRLLALCWAGALAQQAAAQSYPSHPITLVVPVAPAGILDQAARMVQPAMTAALGQSIVIENRPGASGNIGATYVAHAKPDGYTLLIGYSMFHVGNPVMFKELAWDPVKDFTGVGMIAFAPHIIAVNTQQPFQNLKQLVDYARANPGKLNYATSGNGSVPHVGMEMFKQTAHLEITHVPYKGAGPAVQDVIAGNVQMTVATPPSVIAFVRAGRLRALATAAKKRIAVLPDVPTTAEAGFPGVEMEAWVAIFAPAGTPPEILGKVNAALKQALDTPEVQRTSNVAGMETRAMTPAQLDALVKKDIDYWQPVIRKAHIVIE
ncbi:MAG TPA: tripartite tricarboxylate transporter substrate binding protein [Burkholderiales bacterium]|jgi:tripartite-type tricarboxylate transporter receptor subunit TctC